VGSRIRSSDRDRVDLDAAALAWRRARHRRITDGRLVARRASDDTSVPRPLRNSSLQQHVFTLEQRPGERSGTTDHATSTNQGDRCGRLDSGNHHHRTGRERDLNVQLGGCCPGRADPARYALALLERSRPEHVRKHPQGAAMTGSRGQPWWAESNQRRYDTPPAPRARRRAMRPLAVARSRRASSAISASPARSTCGTRRSNASISSSSASN
jgi:hypothetical protein